MPTTCQFKFPRMTPVYYGGEELTGSVYLTTSKRMPLEAIKLTLTGHARVQWTERATHRRLEHDDCMEIDNRTVYNGKEVYVSETIKLVENTILDPHCMCVEKFCFSLPPDLPATCSQQYGEVAYTINLVLQRKSQHNKIFKQRIIVRSRLDLSLRHELSQPHSISSVVKFLVPCVGYVPGQQIAFQLSELDALPDCNRVQVNLCQCFCYRAVKPRPKTKQVERVIATSTVKVVSPIAAGLLHIPLIAYISTTKAGCPLEVSYNLEAALYAKRRILQKLALPLTIGTVPPKTLDIRLPSSEKRDGPFCYDNFASSVVKLDEVNTQLINDKLAEARQQQLQQYIAYVSQQCPNRCAEDIEMTLFKCVKNCDRINLLAVPRDT